MSKEENHEHKSHQSAHHEHKEAKIGMPQMNWNTVALVIVLVFVAALVATWVGFSAGAAANANISKNNNTIVTVDRVALSGAVEKYLNDNLITDSTVSAKIIDVNVLPNGLNELTYEIYQNGAKVSAGNLYTSGDKLIIGQAFDLSKPLPKPETQPTAATEPVKSDKPKVDLYVMSFCPFGNQAEDTFVPDFNLLKNKIDFNVHFIVSVDGNDVQSLHGPAEVVQDKVEACIAKYYGNVAWLNTAVYVNDNCGSASSTPCWTDAAKKFNIDVAKINTCVTNEGVALMQENASASAAAGASGSPTLIINGVNTTSVYQYGNSEAYKQSICSSFNVAPSECNVTLSSATSTTQGGTCGN